jgi:CRISPR system Cascade subunit CasB
MTHDPESPYHIQADVFIDNLLNLDAAGLSRLKRNAGRRLDEGRNVYRVFFPLLPDDLHRSTSALDDYFLIATLFPFDREYRELAEEQRPHESLGKTLRRVREAQRQERREEDNYSSLDRRFEALIDATRGDELRFRLSQAVRLIVSQRFPIDWPRLLRNVRSWDGDRRQHRRFVQLTWAKDYFASTKLDNIL